MRAGILPFFHEKNFGTLDTTLFQQCGQVVRKCKTGWTGTNNQDIGFKRIAFDSRHHFSCPR